MAITYKQLQEGMQMDRTTLLANPEIAKALIGKNYATLLGPDREGDYQRYKDVGFAQYSGQVGRSYGSTLDAYIRSLSDPSPRYNKAELPGLIQGELNQAINQYKGAGVDPSTVPWLTNKYAEAGITTPWADTGQATGYVQPERNYNLAGTPQTQTLASIMNPTTPTKYYQFKGSPDVFDQSGNYVSSTQASAIPNFFQNVQQLDYVRPEVKSTTDFSTYSGKPVSVSAFTNPPPTPQGGTGTGGGTGDYSSVIQGAMTAIPTVSAEQGKVDQTYQSIIDKMKELEGQTAYQQSQEDLQGVTATKAAIRDLTAQLTALNASTAATQTNIEGRPMSMDAIVGQQGEVGRQNAIKALGLSSQIQALNGNLQTAIDSVNKMVDLKYQPITQQLNELNILLQQNRDALSNAEKKVADSLSLQNNIKLKQLDIKIADEKAWETNANQALANGAPISVITNARTLYAKGDEDGARALLSKYTGTPSNELGAGGRTDQLYSGLTSSTATAVRSKVSKFSTEPIIQNFATIQDGANFAQSLLDTTTNPADDQALIYSLAKALDPGSVVREGEYATAQKYAQSWIQAYGKGITQALAGTGFLSETARKNIKATINQKYESSRRSYDNLYQQYTTGINQLTGRNDGANFLVDYTTPAIKISPTDNYVDKTLGTIINQSATTEPTSWFGSIKSWLFGK